MKYTELDTPALLIDRKIMTENIRWMQAYADRYGVTNSHGKGVIWDFPSATINRIFDEHAIIDDDPAFRDFVHVGQKVRIIPVHICPVCNLYDTAYVIEGDEVVDQYEIAARGKLQ